MKRMLHVSVDNEFTVDCDKYINATIQKIMSDDADKGRPCGIPGTDDYPRVDTLWFDPVARIVNVDARLYAMLLLIYGNKTWTLHRMLIDLAIFEMYGIRVYYAHHTGPVDADECFESIMNALRGPFSSYISKVQMIYQIMVCREHATNVTSSEVHRLVECSKNQDEYFGYTGKETV